MSEERKNPAAAESGHWYERDGTPCYEVPNKSKGGMRPTTLRDAKKLNLIPSVTTLLRVIDKPALKRYFQQQMVEAALSLTDKEAALPEKEKVARIYELADEHRNAAAQTGTDFHAWVERMLTDLSTEAEDYRTDLALQVVKDLLFSNPNDPKPSASTIATERTVVAETYKFLPYAGKLDGILKLHDDHWFRTREDWVASQCAEYWSQNIEPRLLLDVKVRGNIKQPYDEDVAQLAAYKHGIESTLGQQVHLCASLLVDSAIFDEVKVPDPKEILENVPKYFNLHLWPLDEVEVGREMFEAAAMLWTTQQKLKKQPWVPDPIA